MEVMVLLFLFDIVVYTAAPRQSKCLPYPCCTQYKRPFGRVLLLPYKSFFFLSHPRLNHFFRERFGSVFIAF